MPEREVPMEAQKETAYHNFIAEIENKNADKIANREDTPDGKTLIETRKGEKFTVEKITNPEDKRIDTSHKLLEKNYPKEDVDTPATTKAALKEQVVGDPDSADPKLNIHTVEKGGEVVGTAQSATLESFNENRKGDFVGTDKKFVMIPYLTTRESERRKGLGNELLLKSIADAKAQEPNLDSVLMETGKQEEKFLNEAGLKRLYIETSDGTYEEVLYVQSILADDWDKKKGTPKPGKEPVPNHLMMGLLDREGNEISTEELIQKIRAVMNYNSYQTPDYFQGGKRAKKGAFIRHERELNTDLEALEKFLKKARDGKVKLLSAEDRQKHTDKITEHTAADEADKPVNEPANYRDY